jgi:hypothetical protein
MSPPPLERLLDDEILLVLQRLPIKTLRLSVARVSKRMRRLAMSSAALDFRADLKFLSFGATKGITSAMDALAKLGADRRLRSVTLGNHKWGTASTRKLLQLVPQLERLDVSSSKKVAQSDFADFALPAAPNLCAFTWSWAYDVPERAFLNLIRGRSGLELLDLSSIEGLGDDVPLGADERRLHCVTDVLLKALASTCSRLKTLRLSGSLRITDAGIQALAASCRELAVVSLKVQTVFDHGDKGLLYGGVTSSARGFFPADVELNLIGFPNC